MNSDVSYLEDCTVPCLPGRTHCLHQAAMGLPRTKAGLSHFADQHFDGPNKLHVCCHCWMTAGRDVDGIFHFPVVNQRLFRGALEPPTEPDSLRAVIAPLEAERDTLRAEVAALRKALGEVMPLLDECDCTDSDRTDMLCPCKAARAALADKQEQP